MHWTPADPPATSKTRDVVVDAGAGATVGCGRNVGGGAVVAGGVDGDGATVAPGPPTGAVPGPGPAATVVSDVPGTDGVAVVDDVDSATTAADDGSATASDVTSPPTRDTAVHARAIDPSVPRTHTATSAARFRTRRVCRAEGKAHLNRTTSRAPYSAAVAIILLVEDDGRIRAALARALEEKGHAVRSASSGMAGLADAVDERPDVVVLDLGLPDVDGTEVLRMLRAVSTVPVIVATARDDEEEIVRTLDAGADDYVVKPFSGDQLDARVRALLRRGPNRAADVPEVIEVGGIVIDPSAREARLDGAPLDLSRKEFDLLHHLAANAGRVVTKR